MNASLENLQQVDVKNRTSQLICCQIVRNIRECETILWPAGATFNKIEHPPTALALEKNRKLSWILGVSNFLNGIEQGLVIRKI